MDSYRASSAEKSASFLNTGIEGRRRSALLKGPADCRAFWNACLMDIPLKNLDGEASKQNSRTVLAMSANRRNK